MKCSWNTRSDDNTKTNSSDRHSVRRTKRAICMGMVNQGRTARWLRHRVHGPAAWDRRGREQCRWAERAWVCGKEWHRAHPQKQKVDRVRAECVMLDETTMRAEFPKRKLRL